MPAEGMETSLAGAAHQVHFDALLRGVPDGAMLERCQVEICAKLPVHADEQVLVEGGGDAERIVVGEDQVRLGFDRGRRRAAADRPDAALR